MTNPLLADWDTPFELPPFDAIEDAHFAPAFDAALGKARAAIAAIADDPAPATFANTIEALETADLLLSRVGAVFFNLAGAESNPEREALQRDLAPKLSAYNSEVVSNAALWTRIEAVWQAREELGLDPQQMRLLELTRRSFARAGAALEDGDKARLAAVRARLAVLGTEFGQNLLADERDWQMPLDADVVAELPGFVADA
ncbi:MAG: peptidase M3, partial [Pseudomonadota bacterium]